jgi:hypothetical protein
MFVGKARSLPKREEPEKSFTQVNRLERPARESK